MTLPSRRGGISTRVRMIATTSLCLALGLAACTKHRGHGRFSPDQTEASAADPSKDSPVTQVIIPSGKLPMVDASGSRITFPGGGFINLVQIDGVNYLPIHGTLDDASFKNVTATAKAISTSEKERLGRMGADLDATLKALTSVAKLLNVKTYPEYGFFIALMPLHTYENLPAVTGLPHTLVLNPEVRTPMDQNAVRVMDQEALTGLDPRSASESFSGLVRMGVPEFLAQIRTELGDTADVDGRRVLIGVTDTGVTLNHPTFTNEAGNPRIVRLRDFSGEGRIYFNPAARFEVVVPIAAELPAGVSAEQALKLTADVIPPQKGTATLPVADKFSEVSGLLLVSPELRQILTTPGSGAKLGVFSEAIFASDDETVDINQNGKSTDNLSVILLPAGEGTYKLYFSSTGDLDFRKASVVGNWNDTKQTIHLSAEKFGFDIASTTLKNASSTDVAVIGASIVGYDPGNHGSHVSGIIAGRHTLTNDDAGTLARGSVPNANFMVNRVCANNGGCEYTEAVIDAAEAGAEVVNMSIGGLSPYNDGYAVDEILMDRLTELHNTLFVVSAGNSGPGINTVGSPSTGRHAISVAATASRSLIERQYQWPAKGKPSALAGIPTSSDDDFLLFFSSRGPSGAGGFKPDIAAPGTELSSVQLNAASGKQSGLAVYWGTSMAAPSATGAIALLIDAAKRYNELYPETKLPIDALTIRKVVVSSARPFDVTRYDTSTGAFTRGQYTWIDQGLGMINLPRAWAALKAERDSRLPSAVFGVKDGVREDIAIDYQVRVLRTNPNGFNYDGSIEQSPEVLAQVGPRFGRGIWLDAKANDHLIPVQVARRLPTTAASREDQGDLKRLLATTKDDFVLKTIIFGSNTPWVKAGALNQLSCAAAPSSQISVVGEGAIDAFDAPEGPRSLPQNESTLNVCIDREALNSLPAGDHGALILAYRTKNGQTEANPAFIVPVYVTLPQRSLAGSASYDVAGTVQSFGVDRHYVDVPAGVSLVTVKIEVPEARVSGTSVKGCMGVRLYAYEAGNTATPSELATAPTSIARNCSDVGAAQNESRVITYSRTNPKAGIWNLLVFGRYQFASSDYKLTVEYANVRTTPDRVVGTPAALVGTALFEVLDSSFAAEPNAEASRFALAGLLQSTQNTITLNEVQQVPDKHGVAARTYGADISSVTISTGGSTGNDLDLYVQDCTDNALTICEVAGTSAGSTDVEKVVFTPVAGHFYAAMVVGYSVSQNAGVFTLEETRALAHQETGSVAVTSVSPSVFDIGYTFDSAGSQLLTSQLFLSGDFAIIGSIELRTVTGALMTQIPVTISSLAP